MQWIKCSDRLPEKNKKILFFKTPDFFFVGYVDCQSEIVSYDCDYFPGDVNNIFWQSLPEPPQEQHVSIELIEDIDYSLNKSHYHLTELSSYLTFICTAPGKEKDIMKTFICNAQGYIDNTKDKLDKLGEVIANETD